MQAEAIVDRLPVTFGAFFYDQVKNPEILFPAEKKYFERLLALLDRLPADELGGLFAPMRDAESKMGVNDRNFPRKKFTLEQVDFLNRSPHYAEWRTAVTRIFDRINPLLDAEVARKGRPRLVVVLSPADMPVGPDRMWLRIAERGRRVPVQPPETVEEFTPLLMTGAPREKKAPSLLDACARANDDPYSAWGIESGEQLASFSTHPKAVRMSYERIKNYRSRLMDEVQRVVESEQIRGPRQLGARLKELKPRANEGELSADPVMAEFLRATLLAGNGTLLVNNTFVEWATVTAVRRAKPVLAVIGFGIRNKVKPFSSLLIYTDQETASPIPTQADMLGSYVDLEIFYQYVWQEFGKYPEYRNNTAYLFAAEGMDEMLLIAPQDFPLPEGRLTLPQVHGAAVEWLRL